MTRVKVCGITTPEDGVLAAEAGAAAIGMVFWAGSPRAVTEDRARRIVAALPPFVQTVGVFVDATPAAVLATATAVGLDVVQLHGDEQVDAWRGFARPLLKALTLETCTGSPWPALARAVLLDAHDPQRRGGTGRTIDWDRAREVARRHRVVLAGGLSADNVADAIARVAPVALDVSSGVERSPGVKDPARLHAFFDAVRRADTLDREAARLGKES